MKKIILMIMMFFSFGLIVYADEELLINNLEITNGEISPNFDQYNNYYSVTINKEITELNFNLGYNTEKYEIEINNNNNLVNNKLVYVTVLNRETEEQNTYIFKIFLDDIDDKVINVENDTTSLNIEPKEKNSMLAPIVGTICFILIILVYYVLFLR